jgi:transcriptional regulator with XRE-family HTH domain
MRLYDVMQEKGFTIRALAAEAGIAPTTIHYILNGRNGQPHYASPTIRRNICKVLGVKDASSIDEFAAAIQYYQGKDDREVEVSPLPV